MPCDPGALVKAVATANDSPDPDILSLAPNCVYTLTAVADTTWVAGLPSIEGQLTVNGNHATIDRAQSAPQFRIIVNWGDLTLNEVTITGGHAPDGVGTNSSGDGNSGGSGGGIYSLDGHVTLIDGAVVSGNKPDDCDPVDDVPGCVNDVPTARTQRSTEAADLATANRAAAAAMSRR